MNDRLDVPMHDADVLDEIEMTSNLMIAASETDGPLTQQSIDEILGLWWADAAHEQAVPPPRSGTFG